MRRALQGKRIIDAEIAKDEIVFGDAPQTAIRDALVGRTLQSVGRKGKYWWLDFGESPVVFGHLGMAGWIREIGAHTIRLREHGNAPLDDPTGRPKFLKFLLTADDGSQVVLTDGRRLARVWLGESASADPRVSALGPDVLENPWSTETLAPLLAKRKAPIKALLLNQELFAGVGNWIADEVLFQARIAPARHGATLTPPEIERLCKELLDVVSIGVEVGADSSKYPDHWLFNHRWGGGKGVDTFQGAAIVRETIGGRTTAWAPTLQK